MKGIILRLVLALAALTIVPNALAADTDGGNFFLDAKFGKTFGGPTSKHSGYFSDPQSSWGVDGGYRWKLDDARSLGFDVGYMHFGHVADVYDPFNLFSEAMTARAISLGGHFQYLFGDDKASIFQVRAGLLSVRFDASYSDFRPGFPATIGSDSWHERGEYFGVGIGRYITQSFSLILAYNRYSSQDTRQFGRKNELGLDWIGLEAEYRF